MTPCRRITTALKAGLSQEKAADPPRDLRPAAVLIPVVAEPEGCKLLLTKRASMLRRQPGDIAFPGGAVDTGDENPLETALRESREEVGLVAKDVGILGRLRERATVTGFWLTPYVGVVNGQYAFKSNEEVAEILLVPFSALGTHVRRLEKRELPDGTSRTIYHYQYGPHDIWGITGRLVKEILDITASNQ